MHKGVSLATAASVHESNHGTFRMNDMECQEAYASKLFTGAGDRPMEDVSNIYWRNICSVTHPKFCLDTGNAIGGYIDFLYMSPATKVAPINLYGIVDTDCNYSKHRGNKQKQKSKKYFSFSRLLRACIGQRN